MIRESHIEAYLVIRAKQLGGDTRKVQWIGRLGAPDRLVLLPGRHLWVELKRPGELPRASQVREHARLAEAGIVVHVCDSYESVDRVLAL